MPSTCIINSQGCCAQRTSREPCSQRTACCDLRGSSFYRDYAVPQPGPYALRASIAEVTVRHCFCVLAFRKDASCASLI